MGGATAMSVTGAGLKFIGNLPDLLPIGVFESFEFGEVLEDCLFKGGRVV
jgi:hypothetical protein